jgi:hypothetical protein
LYFNAGKHRDENHRRLEASEVWKPGNFSGNKFLQNKHRHETRRNFSLYLTKFLNDVSNEDPNWRLNLRPLSTLRNWGGLSERQERLTRDVRSRNPILLVGVWESTHYDEDSSHKTIRISDQSDKISLY